MLKKTIERNEKVGTKTDGEGILLNDRKRVRKIKQKNCIEETEANIEKDRSPKVKKDQLIWVLG